jgi:hypothetical protein
MEDANGIENVDLSAIEQEPVVDNVYELEPAGETEPEPESVSIPKADWDNIMTQVDNFVQLNKNLIEQNRTVSDELKQTKIKLDALTKEKISDEIEIKTFVWEADESGFADKKFISVTVRYMPASSFIRNALLTNGQELQKEMASLKKDLDGKISELDYNTVTELLPVEKQLALMQYQSDIAKLILKYALMNFKLIIDDSQCVTADKKLIRGSIDSEFYQNIDTDIVNQTNVFFRTYHQM